MSDFAVRVEQVTDLKKGTKVAIFEESCETIEAAKARLQELHKQIEESRGPLSLLSKDGMTSAFLTKAAGPISVSVVDYKKEYFGIV